MKPRQPPVGKKKKPETISLILADDHAVLRSGLRLLISEFSDMEVLEEAGDFPDAFRKVKALQPDIVIMDITMPGGDPFVEIANMLEASPKSRVLVLSMHEDGAYLRRVLESGASGYVCKKVADQELISAVRAVHEGRTFVDLHLGSPPVSGMRSSEFLPEDRERASGKRKPLSPREEEVLILVAKGHTNQEIANVLKVGVKSVETYRGRVMDKLDLKNRAELVEYAIEHELF